MVKTIILSPAGYEKSAKPIRWFLLIWGSAQVITTTINFFGLFESTLGLIGNIVLFMGGVSSVVISFYYDAKFKNLPKVVINENSLLIRKDIFSRDITFNKTEILDIRFEKKFIIIKLINNSVQKIRLRTDYDVMLDVKASINYFMNEKEVLV